MVSDAEAVASSRFYILMRTLLRIVCLLFLVGAVAGIFIAQSMMGQYYAGVCLIGMCICLVGWGVLDLLEKQVDLLSQMANSKGGLQAVETPTVSPVTDEEKIAHLRSLARAPEPRRGP